MARVVWLLLGRKDQERLYQSSCRSQPTPTGEAEANFSSVVAAAARLLPELMAMGPVDS